MASTANETAAGVGDVAFLLEQARREKIPVPTGGLKHYTDAMIPYQRIHDEATRHGYYSGRSMTDILNNPASRQYFDQLPAAGVQQRHVNKMNQLRQLAARIPPLLPEDNYGVYRPVVLRTYPPKPPAPPPPPPMPEPRHYPTVADDPLPIVPYDAP